MYEELRKSRFDPHDAMVHFVNINFRKLAIKLDCHYPYLIEILNGKRKAGKRLEADIWRIVDILKSEKITNN